MPPSPEDALSCHLRLIAGLAGLGGRVEVGVPFAAGDDRLPQALTGCLGRVLADTYQDGQVLGGDVKDMGNVRLYLRKRPFRLGERLQILEIPFQHLKGLFHIALAGKGKEPLKFLPKLGKGGRLAFIRRLISHGRGGGKFDILASLRFTSSVPRAGIVGVHRSPSTVFSSGASSAPVALPRIRPLTTIPARPRAASTEVPWESP